MRVSQKVTRFFCVAIFVPFCTGNRKRDFFKPPETPLFPTVFVGLTGFEPATFCSQSRRATKLRYSPFMHSRTWQVNTSFHCSVW